MNRQCKVGRCLVVLLVALCGSASQGIAAEAARPLKESEAWLANNRQNSEVSQTKSGLQYKVVRSSEGCLPDSREPVTLHYEASLAANGRVVDSSYQRGSPATFSLRKMIKAWKEGIPLMREGEEWLFYVPPKLGYGSKGAPPLIGSDSVLIFRVELLKVGRCR